MGNAYRTGAALAHMTAGLAGLGAAPKRKKRGSTKASRGASAELRSVVNAFVAGRDATGGVGYSTTPAAGAAGPLPPTGAMSAAYVSTGTQLFVHGSLVAERLVPAGFDPIKARAVKQIRVCPFGLQRFRGPGAAMTTAIRRRTSANFQDYDITEAANELMRAVKAGLSFRDLRDFVDGYRSVISPIRIAAPGGRPSIVPVASATAPDCVVIELTEEARNQALKNIIYDAAQQQYTNEAVAAGLRTMPTSKAKSLTKAELQALVNRVRFLQASGITGTQLQNAIDELNRAVSTGKSVLKFP